MVALHFFVHFPILTLCVVVAHSELGALLLISTPEPLTVYTLCTMEYWIICISVNAVDILNTAEARVQMVHVWRQLQRQA